MHRQKHTAWTKMSVTTMAPVVYPEELAFVKPTLGGWHGTEPLIPSLCWGYLHYSWGIVTQSTEGGSRAMQLARAEPEINQPVPHPGVSLRMIARQSHRTPGTPRAYGNQCVMARRGEPDLTGTWGPSLRCEGECGVLEQLLLAYLLPTQAWWGWN